MLSDIFSTVRCFETICVVNVTTVISKSLGRVWRHRIWRHLWRGCAVGVATLCVGPWAELDWCSVTDFCCPFIVQQERRFGNWCNDVRRRAATADHRRGLGRDQVQDGRWHRQPWVWRLSAGGVTLESVTRASTLLSHACHVLGRDRRRGTRDPGALAYAVYSRTRPLLNA